jgi:hypothetical protein
MTIALRLPQTGPVKTAVAMAIPAFLALSVNELEIAAVLYGFYNEMMLQIGELPERPLTVRADKSVLQERLGVATPFTTSGIER